MKPVFCKLWATSLRQLGCFEIYVVTTIFSLSNRKLEWQRPYVPNFRKFHRVYLAQQIWPDMASLLYNHMWKGAFCAILLWHLKFCVVSTLFLLLNMKQESQRAYVPSFRKFYRGYLAQQIKLWSISYGHLPWALCAQTRWWSIPFIPNSSISWDVVPVEREKKSLL